MSIPTAPAGTEAPASVDPAISAEAFLTWLVPEATYEADFTERNNEDRTLGDYVADLAHYLDRLLTGEVEGVDLAAAGRALAAKHATPNA